jgi:hypothetical protein
LSDQSEFMCVWFLICELVQVLSSRSLVVNFYFSVVIFLFYLWTRYVLKCIS